MSTEYDFDIPYNMKDELKREFRLKWSADRRCWYTTFPKVYKTLKQYQVIKLNIKFTKKDCVKQIGCKWSSQYKSWYCSNELYTNNKELIDSCIQISTKLDESLFTNDTDDEDA